MRNETLTGMPLTLPHDLSQCLPGPDVHFLLRLPIPRLTLHQLSGRLGIGEIIPAVQAGLPPRVQLGHLGRADEAGVLCFEKGKGTAGVAEVDVEFLT